MAPKRKSSSSAPNPDLPRRITRSATAATRGVAAPAPPPRAKPKPPSSKKLKIAAADGPEKKSSAAADNGGTGAAPKAAIIIEASKECRSFTMRSTTVKEGLESALPGISVTINPEKPRRGCFEIRKEDGQVFLSLLSMKRPFSKMKELNMDDVVKDIVNKIS